MKKINLKGISEILSEKELKNVMGGSSANGGMNKCTADCGASISCGGTCSANAKCAYCTIGNTTFVNCC